MQIKCAKIVLKPLVPSRISETTISTQIFGHRTYSVTTPHTKHLFGRPRKRRNYEWVGKFFLFSNMAGMLPSFLTDLAGAPQ